MSMNIEFQNRQDLELSKLGLGDHFSWLNTKKQQALDEFKAAKLPNRKVEHWKYNDMTFLQQQDFQTASTPSSATTEEALVSPNQIKFEDAIQLLLIDGFLVSPITETELQSGLNITKFEDANEQQKDLIADSIDAKFNAKNLLVNLNESINQTGLLIEVKKNTIVEKPIYIRHLSTQQKLATISSQKVLVNIESCASAVLIEHFDSAPQEQTQLALQQTHISVAENAKIEHYRLNLEEESARQASQVKTSLANDATMDTFYLGLGSQLNRTDIDVIHAGRNAECNLTGIYLPRKQQQIDYHTNIEHQMPHCNTNEVFRGIIADQSSATFNGKIHIFQDAQKSDAQLNNKNLLLTNQAEVNTKPELEIYADDVSCAHGATVAQLDDKSVYYLQTRGIDKDQAKKMLSIAFVQELLNQIKQQPVKAYLSNLLDHYMSKIA